MDTKDYAAKLTELASRYMTENMRIWQRSAEVARHLSEGEMRGGDVQRQIAEFARKDGEEFLQNLMTLNMNYYSLLLDMSVDLSNRIFDQVLNAPAPSAPAHVEPAPAAQPSGGTRFELIFEGQPGEVISRPFVVHNKKSATTAVSFEITEFIGEEGAPRFRAPVEFAPERFTLEAGAEQVVECRVRLVPEFAPGRRYMALVRVTNFPGMEIGLIVVPGPGADGAPPSVAAEPDTRPGNGKPQGRHKRTKAAGGKSRPAKAARPRRKK